MIARPNPAFGLSQDQELAALHEMDETRRREAARVASRESRRAGGVPVSGETRLMSESEMPDWLLRAEVLAQERANAPVSDGLMAGPRERRKISYTDDLSERDWARLMESGLDREEFLIQEAERKRKAEEKRGISVSTDGVGASVASAVGVSVCSVGEADGAAIVGMKRGLIAGAGKSLKKAKAADGEAFTESNGATELKEKLGKLLKAVAGTQRLARRVAHLFLQLPRAGDAPGYYDIIKCPISIAEMRERVRNGSYLSITDLDADMALMVKNAHTYNTADSQVYQDADTLNAAYFETRAKLFGEKL